MPDCIVDDTRKREKEVCLYEKGKRRAENACRRLTAGTENACRRFTGGTLGWRMGARLAWWLAHKSEGTQAEWLVSPFYWSCFELAQAEEERQTLEVSRSTLWNQYYLKSGVVENLQQLCNVEKKRKTRKLSPAYDIDYIPQLLAYVYTHACFTEVYACTTKLSCSLHVYK